MSGADFDSVRPRDLVAKVKCPIMTIHAGEDRFILSDDRGALDEALRARRNERDVIWLIPDAGHVLGIAATGPEEYERRLSEFLAGATKTSATAHSAATVDERDRGSAAAASP
jgi:pimeloyl-ACP methyl ester carboxylesterase